MNRKNRGFTLIELIVTVAIIAIFSGVVVSVVGTGSHSYRTTSSNAKVQMETQDIMDQIQNIIIDVNRSIYYSYGDGMNDSVGELVTNDIETAGTAAAKTFFATSGTESSNLDESGNKLYDYTCDVILWNKQEQKIYYACRTWQGTETEKSTDTTNDASGEQSGLADNSTQTEIAGHAEMNDEALMDITDNDMEVADDSEDESESTTVSKRTSKIENKVEKTLLAENVTDFRVDVSKAASERIVRFQFTANVNGKETTTVHAVNLRNQIQVSKPYEGYNKSDSDTPWLLLTNYPEEVEPGKSVIGFSKLMNGNIDPDTIKWVVDSGNGAFTAGAEGSDDSLVTLTANSAAKDGDLITIHVEAQTSDGKKVQSRTAAIKVVSKKVPQSLVPNTTEVLLGVGNTYNLTSISWKVKYSDGTESEEVSADSLTWSMALNIDGITFNSGNIKIEKTDNGPGTNTDNSQFNLKVSYSDPNNAGTNVEGTLHVKLARLDVTSPTGTYNVNDDKNFTYIYKEGGIQNNDKVGTLNPVYTSDPVGKAISTGDKFIADDVGSWNVQATLNMSEIGGFGGNITGENQFNVQGQTEQAQVKLHNDSGLNTIIPGKNYTCSSKYNENEFYLSSDWSGTDDKLEIKWSVSHKYSANTGFLSGGSYTSDITIKSRDNVTLHVGSDEKGFVLEADLTVKDYNGNITHHYRGNMNVKIARGVSIQNTFENNSEETQNFKAFRGRRYQLKAVVNVSKYNSITNQHDTEELKLQPDKYTWIISANGKYAPGITSLDIEENWLNFNITVKVTDSYDNIIYPLNYENLKDNKNVKVEDTPVNAEVVAVDNKTSLFPGDTTKLYLRLWNEAGTLDGQADWSGFSSDELCVVADTNAQTIHQDSIYQNDVVIPIEVKASTDVKEITNITIPVKYKYKSGGQVSNSEEETSINITITPLNMVINPSSYEAYESNSITIAANIYNADSNEDVTNSYVINWSLSPEDASYNLSKTTGNETILNVVKPPESMKKVKITATAKNNSGDIVCTASTEITVNEKNTISKSYNLGKGDPQKLFDKMNVNDVAVNSITASYVTSEGITKNCEINAIPTLSLTTGNICKKLEVNMNADSSDFKKYKYILISVDTQNTLYKFYIYPVELNVYDCETGRNGTAIAYVPTDTESIQRSSSLIEKDNDDNGNGYTYSYGFNDYKAQIRLSIDSRTGVGYFSGDYVGSSAGKWIMRMCKKGTSDWIYYRLENDKWYMFQNGTGDEIQVEKTKKTRFYWDLTKGIHLIYANNGTPSEKETPNTTFWKKWN